MKLSTTLGLAAAFTCSVAVTAFTISAPVKSKPVPAKPASKIQVAILLDVSGSMDGLIEQAKAQLWNMVTTIGKVKCTDATTPKVEIALYEYGRSTNDVKQGYVKQINSFISDLDSLSQNLFSLKTNGGDEFCGHVIYSSLKELQWDAAPENYKVIFIAGNEDFLQGDIHYSRSCTEAKQKGVIVNTIYCGNKQQGIAEHWNLLGECGNGSFSNIDQNVKEEEIPTPYDSLLFVLNDKLNGTYLTYGYKAAYYAENQAKQDKQNVAMSKKAGIARIKAKSNAKMYDNSTWDLVDADRDGKLDEIDTKVLPDSLRNKSKAELKQIVTRKATERTNIQKEIVSVNLQRDNYIAAEKARLASQNNAATTLETEVEKIIREQVKRYNMSVQ